MLFIIALIFVVAGVNDLPGLPIFSGVGYAFRYVDRRRFLKRSFHRCILSPDSPLLEFSGNGIFSIGIFSIGTFSVGIFNIGIFAVGIDAIGKYAHKLVPSSEEDKAT